MFEYIPTILVDFHVYNFIFTGRGEYTILNLNELYFKENVITTVHYAIIVPWQNNVMVETSRAQKRHQYTNAIYTYAINHNI